MAELVTVVIDTREQEGYSFPDKRFVVERRALPAGAYSLAGLERVVAVERKTAENFVHAVIRDRDRFRRELLKLAEYDRACIVVEAGPNDILSGAYRSGAHPSSVVGAALDQGDCWVEYEDLLDRANELLVMDCLDSREQIEKHLDNLIDEKALTCYCADSRFLVAKPFIRRMEEDLARVFANGVKPSPCLSDKPDLQTEIKRIAPRLNSRQTKATAHSISLISGGAGSGKTFTISAITRLCEERDLRVVLCAPTGKAAKRMEEATGREASTIHRLLGFNGKTYARDSENPISADMLIVDEVSMVDVVLAWHLFQAIDLDRTTVVLVGDHNQLPPVGPGNILRDLIESRALPTTILDDVVRQAGILKENSMAILKGEVPKTPQRDTSVRGAWYVADQHTDAERVQRFILDLFEHTLREKLGFDILRDVQVLTPTHKGPLGTAELNTKLQRLIQRKLWNYNAPPVQPGRRPKLLVNDKVIQTRNNYDLGVMNGAMGIVRSVGLDGSLSIEFEDKTVNIDAGSPHRSDIQLAYALTIHKSQGSEFPCSIVIAHKSHSFMHNRNLLYTGVTRASQTAIIVGDHWGIANCGELVGAALTLVQTWVCLSAVGACRCSPAPSPR